MGTADPRPDLSCCAPRLPTLLAVQPAIIVATGSSGVVGDDPPYVSAPFATLLIGIAASANPIGPVQHFFSRIVAPPPSESSPATSLRATRREKMLLVTGHRQTWLTSPS